MFAYFAFVKCGGAEDMCVISLSPAENGAERFWSRKCLIVSGQACQASSCWHRFWEQKQGNVVVNCLTVKIWMNECRLNLSASRLNKHI